MIFSLLNIHNHDRNSSITRVLHTETWDYFTSHLPEHFSSSPKVVKEAIMADINDLVQEFWKTSSGGTVGPSFFEMRRLFEILQKCFDDLEVHFYISVFATGFDLADKSNRSRQTPMRPNRTLTTQWEPNSRQCFLGIERCLISHYLNPKI